MIMKHLMLFIILFLKVYPTIGQNSYCVKLSVGGSIVIPKNAFAFKNSIGIVSLTNINQNLFIETGLSYELINLNNYKNSTLYTSQWSNGPHQTYVSKTANINQSFIKIPLILHINKNKLIYGIGISLTHLVHSTTEQTVNGLYKNNNYPNSEGVLTSSIKSYYEINNSSLNNYRRTNINPCISVGRTFNNRFALNINLEYSLYVSPQFSNKIEPYNLMSLSINSFYIINTKKTKP